MLSSAVSACAQQQNEIAGPAGSDGFGTAVAILPNGNIVVTAPASANGAGAAYLYSADGARISTLSGSHAGDQVGSGGIVVLANGNYLVVSEHWNGDAGAVTWGSANTGATGTVSNSTSLVGSTANAGIKVTPLTNGNYVVVTAWPAASSAGYAGSAVTWCNGESGKRGIVDAHDSLTTIGADAIVPLSNGNYVVHSTGWLNAGTLMQGAVTWGDGAHGTSGAVSATNSLVGTDVADLSDARITPLHNGNYVVASVTWNAAGGAITWVDGQHGTPRGAITATNSVVGGAHEGVGAGGVTALSNGHYVVVSKSTHGATEAVGAVTWFDGTHAASGAITAANSLTGSYGEVTALTNGNYVVADHHWNGGVGAVTWGDGSSATVGVVSADNSLIGARAGDQIGRHDRGDYNGVTPLKNGNYVVPSPLWHEARGAVTWRDGSHATHGVVSSDNSLVGSTKDDGVGQYIIALSNGNYVVSSPAWSNGPVQYAGAVTWADGEHGISGTVSPGNSFIGSTRYDAVGYGGFGAWLGVVALNNGDYIVASPHWSGATEGVGALTRASGTTGLVGNVTAANSILGSTREDHFATRVDALPNGAYVAMSPEWDNAGVVDAGVITLLDAATPTSGDMPAATSVRGTVRNGVGWAYAYDATRNVLVVGRAKENKLTLLRMTAPQGRSHSTHARPVHDPAATAHSR